MLSSPVIDLSVNEGSALVEGIKSEFGYDRTPRTLAAAHCSKNKFCEIWSAGSVKTIPPRVQGEITVNGKRKPGPVGAGSPVKGF